MAQARNIGIKVRPPTRDCTDRDCPFHGSLRVRGVLLDGRVVSAKMDSTVVVRREYLYYLNKFERYERRTSKFSAHNPPCVAASEGDEVSIMETRPISKTKSFVVIEARKGKAEIVGEDYTVEAKTAAARSAPVEAEE